MTVLVTVSCEHSVSVGELGITAEHLETKLHEILELAGTWSAVVLIDEADVCDSFCELISILTIFAMLA